MNQENECIPRVCLDPGHGGHDSGAIGPTGIRESEITLKVAIETASQLEMLGIDSYLTRVDDSYVGLSERTEKAQGYDCLVSIHCNSFQNTNVTGTETIYPKPGGESKALANYIQSKVVGNHKNRGIKMSPSKEYNRGLWVLNMAPCPAALVELEFISNPEMESKFKEEDVIKSYAYKIASAIESWLKSQKSNFKHQKVRETEKTAVNGVKKDISYTEKYLKSNLRKTEESTTHQLKEEDKIPSAARVSEGNQDKTPISTDKPINEKKKSVAKKAEGSQENRPKRGKTRKKQI